MGFESNKRDFKFRLLEGGHPQKVVNKTQAEVEFTPRNNALKYKLKRSKTFYRSSPPTTQVHRESKRSLWTTGLSFDHYQTEPCTNFPNAPIYSLYKKDNITTILASQMIVSLYSYLSKGYCHIGLIYNFVCKISRFPKSNRLFFIIFGSTGCSYTSKLIVVTPILKKSHGVETFEQIAATVHKLRLSSITGESSQLHAWEMFFPVGRNERGTHYLNACNHILTPCSYSYT